MQAAHRDRPLRLSFPPRARPQDIRVAVRSCRTRSYRLQLLEATFPLFFSPLCIRWRERQLRGARGPSHVSSLTSSVLCLVKLVRSCPTTTQQFIFFWFRFR